MSYTQKRTTLQVTFDEQEFLDKLFDENTEGTVVTSVDVKVCKAPTGQKTLVTVRLVQPAVEASEAFDTVWMCSLPPVGQVYKVIDDEWKTWIHRETGLPVNVRYIREVEITSDELKNPAGR